MDVEFSQQLSTFSILLFGFVLGLKHAVEADHLAAVSTIVAERKNILSSAFIGGFWGVGHTLSLLAVGAFVIFLKVQIPPAIETKLEAVVGAMLIILGINALRNLLKKDEIHIHTHDHDGLQHIHIHTHEKAKKAESHHLMRLSPRSIAVGMVHGLAGSAALMLLLLPTIKSPVVALGYISIFGVGSIAGMMLMSVLISLPVHFTAGRFTVLNKGILCAAGLFSFGLGTLIVYEKLV